jgi:hypothetical protein
MTHSHSSIGNPDARFNAFNSHQPYHLNVPGTTSAALLSAPSFTAVEKLGGPYCVTDQLTHPLALSRTDYLGNEASFAIAGSGEWSIVEELEVEENDTAEQNEMA